MRFSLNEDRLREGRMILHTHDLEAVTVKECLENPGEQWRIWEVLQYIFTGERMFSTDSDRRLAEYLDQYLK